LNKTQDSYAMNRIWKWLFKQQFISQKLGINQVRHLKQKDKILIWQKVYDQWNKFIIKVAIIEVEDL
jgi:hypothetical protein